MALWHFSNHVHRVGSHAQTNENRLTPQKQMQPNGNHALAMLHYSHHSKMEKDGWEKYIVIK